MLNSMTALLGTLLAFIGALGVLVTIHEYGHFQVARSLGIKVLRFSVGFGPTLWMRRFGADQTEFAVCAIPLGGYVKMLDEREGPVAEAELPRAFNTQSVGRRFAVVAAGPLANLVLAVLVYWVMYMAGVSGPRPIVGEIHPGGIAAVAGLRAGDEIVAVDGRATAIWDNVMATAIDAILDAREVHLLVRSEQGREQSITLDFSRVSIDDLTRGDFFRKVGFEPRRVRLPPIIGKVIPGEAAAAAGLEPGDVLEQVDGVAINDWLKWVERVRGSPGQTLAVTVRRHGVAVALKVTPRATGLEGALVGRIGAEVAPFEPSAEAMPYAVERYDPATAFVRAIERTEATALTTLKFMRKMLVGEASVDNLSGPISIAQFAGVSAKLGATRFLEFLGLVSVSLAVLNLLPIPLLDGGHLMYFLLEVIMRRPVPEAIQVYGQHIGLTLLLGLMGLAMYNDLMRIF
jgi:regulator of sigma E protease